MNLKKQFVRMGVTYLIGFVLGLRSLIDGDIGLFAFTGGLITFFVFLFGLHAVGRQIPWKKEYVLSVSAFLLLVMIICCVDTLDFSGFLERLVQFFASFIGNPVCLPFFWLLTSIWGDEAEVLQTVLINGIPCVFLFAAALSGVLRGKGETISGRKEKGINQTE